METDRCGPVRRREGPDGGRAGRQRLVRVGGVGEGGRLDREQVEGERARQGESSGVAGEVGYDEMAGRVPEERKEIPRRRGKVVRREVITVK